MQHLSQHFKYLKFCYFLIIYKSQIQKAELLFLFVLYKVKLFAIIETLSLFNYTNHLYFFIFLEN